MLINIHHIQITIPVGEEESARDFYCGILKLEEIPKPQNLYGRGGLWLVLGNQQIHIGTESDFGRIKTKAHIAYQVNDLIYWREKLSSVNIECKDGIPIKGMLRFEFRDPFDNRIELLELV